MMNSFGDIYRLTTFGESHGTAIGGIIDGMPAGLTVDLDAVQRELDRRRPGQSALTTSRKESDIVKILSGIHNGFTTGAPIGFVIENTNQRSGDYSELEHTFRPGHADYTLHVKSGGHRDARGGGRASARETASRVVGGAFARQALARHGISVVAYTSAIGDYSLDKDYCELDLSAVDNHPTRCPDAVGAAEMERRIIDARESADSVGGVVTCIVRGCPVGLGEPVFGRLNQRLGSAMLSINAVKGFEIGDGFDMARCRGSQVMDSWVADAEDPRGIRAVANHSGGIQGGISNGEDIVMRIAFKPIATIFQPIATVNDKLEPVTLQARGRHDPCVVPRAVPVVEAMAAMTIFDALLIDRTRRI